MYRVDFQVRQPNMTFGRFCGSSRPTMISSTQNRLSVQFVSDVSIAQRGFRLEWKIYGTAHHMNFYSFHQLLFINLLID